MKSKKVAKSLRLIKKEKGVVHKEIELKMHKCTQNKGWYLVLISYDPGKERLKAHVLNRYKLSHKMCLHLFNLKRDLKLKKGYEEEHRHNSND